jgi:hypothetical protein
MAILSSQILKYGLPKREIKFSATILLGSSRSPRNVVIDPFIVHFSLFRKLATITQSHALWEQTRLSSIMIYDNFRSISRKHRIRGGTVVIVDWDDTILPSTFVDRWQIENSRDLPLHVSRSMKNGDMQFYLCCVYHFRSNMTIFQFVIRSILTETKQTVSKSLGTTSRVCE